MDRETRGTSESLNMAKTMQEQVDVCGPGNEKINQHQLEFKINTLRKMTLKAKVGSPLGQVKKIIWFWSEHARLLPIAQPIFFYFSIQHFLLCFCFRKQYRCVKGKKNQIPAYLIILKRGEGDVASNNHIQTLARTHSH